MTDSGHQHRERGGSGATAPEALTIMPTMAVTLIGVAALTDPRYLVGIEATAVLT
ncbi:MAG: hypothetical protein M3313_11495 [Actinomycetota bacterium]|nr:hypothetical protein [Actinomycetota bacterium]